MFIKFYFSVRSKKLTLTIPGGAPASAKRSIVIRVAPGSCSEGLIMQVLPVAIAGGNIHNGIMIGKLKAATPSE